MRRIRCTAGIAVLSAITAAIAACAGPSAPASSTHDGPGQPFGRGVAHTYVVSDADGHPQEVGVRLSRAVLDGLPADTGAPGTMALLALPAASGTIVDHVMLNWNPHGHDPVALFGKPHFDVHFYMADPASVDAIDPHSPTYAAQAANFPAPRYVPQGYVPPPGSPAKNAVPAMGLHWTDTADHAIPGQYDFQQIFINGTWDGRYTFMEPMITRDFLLNAERADGPIKQPEAYQRSGLYPTAYHVHLDEATNEYVVALDGLTARQQS